MKKISKILLLLWVMIAAMVLLVCGAVAYADEIDRSTDQTIGETVGETIEETTEGTVEAPTEQNAKDLADWNTWVNEVLVPRAVTVISAAGAIYALCVPVIVHVRKTSDKFRSATDSVNTSNKNAKKSFEEAKQFMEETKKEMAEFKDLVLTQYKNINNRIGQIEKASKNTEKISRIGFSNINELVAKGYAAEIGKVGDNNEQDEEETTES